MNKLTYDIVLDDVHTLQHVWQIADDSMTMDSRLCVKSEHVVIELLLFY